MRGFMNHPGEDKGPSRWGLEGAAWCQEGQVICLFQFRRGFWKPLLIVFCEEMGTSPGLGVFGACSLASKAAEKASVVRWA